MKKTLAKLVASGLVAALACALTGSGAAPLFGVGCWLLLHLATA